MSGSRSAEIVIGVVFLLALLLPVTLGTKVSPPRSVIDVFWGWSKFNLSLTKLMASPGVGLMLVIALYADPSVPWFVSLLVLVAVMLLVIGALFLGSTRAPSPSRSSVAELDDGLDYASRFRRLEDGIANESEPQHKSKRHH